MKDLLSIYATSILGSALLGSGLSILGAQLAARDRAMQTMCVGQSAVLGVILGIGVCQMLSIVNLSETLLTFFLAVSLSAATYVLSEFLLAQKASANTHFAALYSTLLASGYLASALFPNLENHMAQRFFGDLATMSIENAWSATALGAGTFILLKLTQKKVTRDSFKLAVFGNQKTETRILLSIGTLLILCLSIQIAGFLFTVGCLFLPTSILSFSRNLYLRSHLARCALISFFGCLFGFLASLWFSKLPTVPSIIAMITLLGLCIKVIKPSRFECNS